MMMNVYLTMHWVLADASKILSLRQNVLNQIITLTYVERTEHVSQQSNRSRKSVSSSKQFYWFTILKKKRFSALNGKLIFRLVSVIYMLIKIAETLWNSVVKPVDWSYEPYLEWLFSDALMLASQKLAIEISVVSFNMLRSMHSCKNKKSTKHD